MQMRNAILTLHMPRAVSNPQPLIHLPPIWRLNRSAGFHQYAYLLTWKRGGTRPGATEIRKARYSGWFSVIEPASTALVHLLKQELHAAESYG